MIAFVVLLLGVFGSTYGFVRWFDRACERAWNAGYEAGRRDATPLRPLPAPRIESVAKHHADIDAVVDQVFAEIAAEIRGRRSASALVGART